MVEAAQDRLSGTLVGMPQIHPTAVVSPQATLEEGVRVGPLCVVEGPVHLAADVRLMGSNWLRGPMRIGEDTLLYPGACVGLPPQHKAIAESDEVGGVEIGAGCVLREHTTVHAAMKPGERTRVGERLYLMAGAHIGHDCVVGDDVIVCNGSVLAGHVEVHERAYVSGLVSVHQFCRIGTGAMTVGTTAFNVDVPPWCTVVAPNVLGGVNLVGLRRAGVPREEIGLAREAFRRVFRRRTARDEMIAVLEEIGAACGPARQMAEFVRGSKRGVMTGDGRPRIYTLQWLRRAMRPEVWREGLDMPEAAEETLA